MTFEEFEEKIEVVLKEKYPDYEIIISKVKKNNNTKLTGVSIFKRDRDNKFEPNNISAVLYLEHLYDSDLTEKTLNTLATKIFKSCYSQGVNREVLDIIESVKVYDKIKDKIMPCLINKELNKGRMDNIVHRGFLEFYVIYKIDFGDATITINNSMLEMYNVDEQELYEQSLENMSRKDKLDIINLKDMLFEQARKGLMFENPLDNDNYIEKDMQMYVVTNAKRTDGARFILDSALVHDLYRMFGEGFYMIPSSIHEWIVYTHERNEETDLHVNEMIRCVNQEEVMAEEILGDKAYYYNGASFTLVDV